MPIGECLKGRQCLLMAAQRITRLLDIEVPVAQAVEAVGQGSRIVHGACQCKCLLVIVPCLCVSAPRPQKAQVD